MRAYFLELTKVPSQEPNLEIFSCVYKLIQKKEIIVLSSTKYSYYLLMSKVLFNVLDRTMPLHVLVLHLFGVCVWVGWGGGGGGGGGFWGGN